MTIFTFLIVSLLIFSIGIFGILFNKKNLIVLLMSIEIILLGANMNFVVFLLRIMNHISLCIHCLY